MGFNTTPNVEPTTPLKLTGSQLKQLRDALLSAFPSAEELAMMVRDALDVNLAHVAGGSNLSLVTFSLIGWAEAHGKLQELIAKAHEANPGNSELGALLTLFSSREGKQVQPVNQGLEALSILLENPKVQAKVFAFRSLFEVARKQVDLLGDYKDIHDQLHDLQRGCYDQIKIAVDRIQEDSEAADNLRDYQLTLSGFTNRVRQIALRGSEAAGEAVSVQKVLEQAGQALQRGLGGSDVKSLREAVRALSRILSTRPPLIDTALRHAAQALELPKLVAAFQVVYDWTRTLNLDAERVQRFRAGVEALSQIDSKLSAMIEAHTRWQDMDVTLRLIEFRLEFSLESGAAELGDLWPDLKERSEQLSTGNADGWGTDLQKVGVELDGAIALQDPVKVRRPFKRYRQLAADRFYWVDKALREQCGALRTIGEPLDSVLAMI